MNVLIQRLYDPSGQETGAILSAVVGAPTTIQQKYFLENQLVQYAFDSFYPGQGLILHRDLNNDTPSITVIKNIDALPQQTITI